jgi:signal transduction histidine kinase
MRSYRDLPIRAKLQGIVVLTCGVALLAVSTVLTFYARATLLRAKAQELYAAAQMVGYNSAAALTFRDAKAADAILGALRANDSVTLACTYDLDGQVFASYKRDAGAIDCPGHPSAHGGSHIVSGHMLLFERILLRGQPQGTVFLETDLKDVNRQLDRFLGIVLLMLLASLGLALMLASVLQRIISGPIRQLAATALSVDENQDYSIRAQKNGDDEVGALFDAFNAMLGHIHQRDMELLNAQNDLERRVGERTAHLNLLIRDNKKMELELRHAQKLEAVGSLAAGIAHEINTPIQFVSDNTHFLRDAFQSISEAVTKYASLREEIAKDSPEGRTIEKAATELEQANWNYLRGEIPRAIEQSIQGLRHVATIVRAMKDFSHVNHQGMAAADLNQAIQSTLIVARNELKYVADVACDYGNIPPVVCSLGDLNQVFLNLLINAAHAIGDAVKGSARKGRIAVRTRQEGEYVEIAIADTGTGISEEVRDKIFDPFFTTKEVGRGTGQGLAIARSIIVNKHGGTLTFETEVGRGTTFYVRLPVNGVPTPSEVATR